MHSPVQALLEALHAACRADDSGEVASYIPGLAAADPAWFGICIATTDGHVYEVGDTRVPFTIQSMSKPFTYGLALEDRGPDGVAEKIGVEPSGEAFNSISLSPDSGRPLNPMINAGAIAAASLVAGGSLAERRDRILGAYARHAGRPLGVDRAVLDSERETGHRNRAIGHMLRTFGILEEDPDAALELYFHQCSVSVDCYDISVMAATLANGGVNPLTGERALARAAVPRVLSVMTTCGMYDAAGNWVDSVGMPAKSGVSGGILAVLPGQLGVGVFSPRLDAHGNSARGVEVCRRLSEELELHFLGVARPARATVRADYDIASVPSTRRRKPEETAVLASDGRSARILELQGDLLFAGAERIVRELVAQRAELEAVVLDLREVARFDGPAARLLLGLADRMAAEERALAFVDDGLHATFAEALAGHPDTVRPPVFGTLDAATEWCEERLLGRRGVGPVNHATVTLAEHALCRGLDPDQLAEIERLVRFQRFADGEQIVFAGLPAQDIHLLVAGEVTVTAAQQDGGVRRLATLVPGTTFGELAVLGESRRTADVHAHGPADVLLLSAADFARLGVTRPALQAALLSNMLAGAYETVARLTREVFSSLGR